MRFLALLLALATAASAEVVDRLAVSVGDRIITERQIELHIRTAALLNGEPPKLTATDRRRAAQRLIELVLIRSEMENNRYPAPTADQVEEALQSIRKQRFAGDREKLAAALAEYGIKEANLRENLRAQLAIVSFIDFRFRPGVQIPEADLKDYYEFDFLEAFRKQSPGATPPAYEAVRAQILETITQGRIDNLLDRWLNQTETQVRIRWVDSAFEKEKP